MIHPPLRRPGVGPTRYQAAAQRVAIIRRRLSALRQSRPCAQFAAHLEHAMRQRSIRGARDVDSIVRAAARRWSVDPALVHAVIRAESAYDALAVSRCGALGLMQLMPATAATLGVNNPFDPIENVEAGTRYLRIQLDAFDDVSLALAAYNAGPSAVRRYGGIPPYPETQAYVSRVLAYWREARSSP